MERTVYGCHRLGESLSTLPAGQGTPPRSGTALAHTCAYAPFSHIHMNLVGPLPLLKSFTHLFTIMDRISRLQSTAQMLCFRNGRADLGSQQSSHKTADPSSPPPCGPPCATCLTSSMPLPRRQHTIRNPKGWWVECFHLCLKDMLLARCASAKWPDHLPWILLGLHSTAREDDNTTPALAVFGSPLILPGQFLDFPELPSVTIP
jgi:hypothetical protein